MYQLLFRTIGIVSVLLLAIGITNKKAAKRDLLFAVGGIGLLVYSLYLGNIIFVTLQSIFTAVSIYKLFKSKRKKRG